MAAATDKTYRSQRFLDIVFAVSCILMLVSVVWMFADDYFRDWKVEQREFRDVEEAIAQRAVVRAAPDGDKMKEVDKAAQAVADGRKKVDDAKQKVAAKVNEVLPKKVKSEDKFQAIKAELDSKVSLYDIAVDERNRAKVAKPNLFEGLDLNVKKLRQEVDELRKQLAAAQTDVDANKAALAAAMKPVTDAEQELSNAEDKLKELVGEFDRFHKLAEQKRWGAGDWFRSLPVLDAFASPIRIQQTTLESLPINYNFKYVTRYDRCQTCHLGIDRAAFSRQALTELSQEASPELQQKLQDAKESLKLREKIGGATSSLNPDNIQLKTLKLSPEQVTEFCAHPRLDLFVDGNSPHPAESFGCTICHGGQGSATGFLKASHSPNTVPQKHEWEHNSKLSWEHDHFWDFPMLPKRFIESSCVKCHHQMTDLVRAGSEITAPKLMHGYNLVRENGCFGCHEIAGMKGGRSIGPDLRLEPTPPLDAYTAAEKAKMLADTQNPPGTMRKVGPSLRRISEKTNADWMRLWIKSPRTFRPDTKMPHFYRLSNNRPDVLPDQQKEFPDAEINAIVTYLLEESGSYLKGTDKFRLATQARLKELESKNPALRSDKENLEIEELKRRLELFAVPTPLAKLLPDLPEAKDGKAKEDQLKHGRQLFSERGCLACHINEATAKAGNGLPAIAGDAHFGPNLSRIAAKLGTGDKDSARRWLVQWIMNPTIHNPRTYMPVTHLSLEEANDVAVWLLNQKADWPDAEEKKLVTETLTKPKTQTLKDLAKVFLVRVYSHRQVEEFLAKGFPADEVKTMKLDQDERELAAPLDDHKLKIYIGKKAINQLGCFGCHDVPGFEYAKPIGTPLNDWGKKDPERLAFEDAGAFVRKHHYRVDNFAGKNGKPIGPDNEGKTPYDRFFYQSLEHHQREGFLNQKLTSPRSYDYDRMRAWDDRLRMPQFRFARAEPRSGESPADFRARAMLEEAQAREAVMTFILGLVAEPVPPKYVYKASPDRQAEIKGRQVLDKFNCAGCHLVRSGAINVKMTPVTRELLATTYDKFLVTSTPYKEDYRFADHNAWVGSNPLGGDRLTVHGLNAKLVSVEDVPDEYKEKLPGEVKQLVQIQLTDAVRFQADVGGKKQIHSVPAYTNVLLPARDLLSPAPEELAAAPFGGTFANLLVPYLQKANSQKYEGTKAPPAAPPPLLREGEKTQPDWLFRFLRNPHEIRPFTVLRMPKFNMSDEDAIALVNYFAGADRVSNPAFGLTYPYFKIPERDESYLEKKTAEYVARLKKEKRFDQRVKEMEPFWDQQAKDFTEKLESRKKKLADATKEVESAKEAEGKEKDKGKLKELIAKREAAEKAVADLTLQVANLDAEKAGMDVKALRKDWERKQVYVIDAYRMVTATGKESLCLGCHQVGNVQPKERQGPNLDLAWQRLRPRWTERWLGNPQRLIPYLTPMPQNFPSNKRVFQENFHGTSLEQVIAARDFLMMYPKVVNLPAIRQRPVSVPGGKL